MNAQVVGILEDVPVAFGDLFASVDLLVVEGSPFDEIIGDPTMKDLGWILDLVKERYHIRRAITWSNFHLYPTTCEISLLRKELIAKIYLLTHRNQSRPRSSLRMIKGNFLF